MLFITKYTNFSWIQNWITIHFSYFTEIRNWFKHIDYLTKPEQYNYRFQHFKYQGFKNCL